MIAAHTGPGVTVRLAPADTSPYALLRALGAGRVTRRLGRAPVVEHGHVSVSRTDGLVAVALADHPVGVDVERVRALPDLERLLRDHLSVADAAAVRRAQDPVHAFHALWVRLEALLKAEGVGIVDGLDPAPEVRARWRVTPLDAGPDHCAALATPAASALARPSRAQDRASRTSRDHVGPGLRHPIVTPPPADLRRGE